MGAVWRAPWLRGMGFTGEGRMREPYTQLYVHLVWATWDRAPLMEGPVFGIAEQAIRRECARMHVNVEAIGGMPDHVHLLVRIPTSLSVAKLVQQVKGSTSHLLTSRFGIPFRWQGGYGAFTVSKSVLPRVRDYVLNQEAHHREGTTFPAAEPPPRAGGAEDSPNPIRATEPPAWGDASSPRRRTSCGCCSEFTRPAYGAEGSPNPDPRHGEHGMGSRQ